MKVRSPLSNDPTVEDVEDGGRWGQVLTFNFSRVDDRPNRHDALSRNTSITDALGGTRSLAYNAASELISETNPLGQTTSFGYDLLGQLTTITDSLGNVTTNAFDAVGNRTSVTDPLSQTTAYAYDALRQLISQTDPNGGVVAYAYDAAGNLLSLTDPGGNTTSWTYDALHQAIQETNELGHSRYFQFDVVGNLTERTDRNGRVREFDYDALRRLTEERWVDAGTVVNTINLGYDAASQLISASDAVSAYAYQYNELGLMTQEDNFGTSVGPHAVLDYTFDALGNRTSLIATVNGVDDFQNNYTYDALSRMTTVQQTHSDPGGTGVLPVSDKRVDISYNSLGQFTGIDRYADLAATELVVSSTYGYDSASRLINLDHSGAVGGSPDLASLASYSWAFDNVGQITQATSPDGTSDYSYDSTGQLIGAVNSFTTDETYSYDANGNRNMSGYVVGPNNQILSGGNYTYDYDAEGNRTKETNIVTGEVTEYDYDHRNRLTRITERSSDGGPITKQVDYTYDLYGRRLAKHIDLDGDGTVDEEDFYVYDGQRHERGNAGDHIILAFEDSDGPSGPEPATPTNRYLHGPAVDQIFADEQLLDEVIDEVLYPLTDQLGSVRDLAVRDESTGDTTIANHIIYDSFGQILSETNTAIDHIFAYTGRERDEESSLQYNRYRYYHFATATWMSVDPLGFAAGDFNLGRYVANGATNATDPSGLVDPDVWYGGKDPRAHRWAELRANLPNATYNPPSTTWRDVLSAWTGGFIPNQAEFDQMRREHEGQPAIGIVPNPNTAYEGIMDRLRRMGHDEEVQEFEKFMHGPVADPDCYNEDGEYIGPKYGAPPVPWGPKFSRRAPSNKVPRKPVNLPSDHIASGHMRGGSRVSPNKDLFPDTWSRSQVELAVKDAYKSAKRIRTQGDRVLVRGTSNGKTIEMWINKATKTIETAYPVGS